ncbi:MAG TPA: MlaD family protein [Burkholderiales bacterium]|jgi:phospholipid/cholesterol/gamma-HCH transport system substrate-binding protein|nr:MlaD family protein [Burkholderiales bacterium]
MENRAYALLTGVFLIGIVAAIIVWAQWLGGDRHERLPYRVVATQPVSGLNPQASVRYRGINVGRVTAIALDPKDRRRILVDIEVDKEIPITRGTYAQLGMEGITGVAYVHLLDDGKDEAPLAAAPDNAAQSVGEIAMRPSFMDTISDSAEDLARDTRVLVASLNKLLDEDNRASIKKTLASLERVSRNLDVTTERVARWVDDDNRKLARQSLERLNDAAATMPELAREAQRLAQETRALVAQVGRLSTEAQGTTASLREGTLPQMNSLAESVERGAQRVGRLATELNQKPDSLLWGRAAPLPGPGEPGFK